MYYTPKYDPKVRIGQPRLKISEVQDLLNTFKNKPKLIFSTRAYTIL